MGEWNQSSFSGGMNLLPDDTRIQPNQYRVGFNLRNRYDSLDLIQKSLEDATAPIGLKQELVTFGIYVILFVKGLAYYKRFDTTGWTGIRGFSMNPSASRFWTKAVPVSETNYARFGVKPTDFDVADGRAGVRVSSNDAAATNQGNLPGLLVQDGTNQPQFIYIDQTSLPIARTTQTYEQWNIVFDSDGVTVITDNREYVPVGTVMEFDGVTLFITAPDGVNILRSVSGRPLDFVINVAIDGSKGGNAYTTAYTVGVGGISALKLSADGSIFVGAGLSNFSVSKNTTQNAPTLWGEYTFIRRFLFNAACLSDRVIFDSLGDTRFIDFTGVRSFNAVQQLQNEGKNSPFTADIQSAFTGIIQQQPLSAAILFDDFELYGVQTIFGPSIAVYDAILQCWVGFDTTQTGGKRIKAFAKIELTTQALFAITEDDKLYQIYGGTEKEKAAARTGAICSSNLSYIYGKAKQNGLEMEIKPSEFRACINNITENVTVSITPFVNNRQSKTPVAPKTLQYTPSEVPYIGQFVLPDVDTQLSNVLFSTPNCNQGWKCFYLVEWNNGSITQLSAKMVDLTPKNPLTVQAQEESTL